MSLYYKAHLIYEELLALMEKEFEVKVVRTDPDYQMAVVNVFMCLSQFPDLFTKEMKQELVEPGSHPQLRDRFQWCGPHAKWLEMRLDKMYSAAIKQGE